VNLEFAGRPIGNAVLGGMATSRHVPVIECTSGYGHTQPPKHR
jgi:hypothetical protein